MAHIEYLESIFSLKGKTVVDVGAGDGVYSRQLDQAGATVTAVEVDPVKVSNASTNLPTSIETKLGKAEQLPLKDQSQELACFFFSLHHVPIGVQETAFVEVRRVLKPGGRLHVVEPYPFGTMFDVVRLVEDETYVRTNSHKVLNRLGDSGNFNLLAKKEYVLTREYPTLDFFLEKIVRPDTGRLAAFENVVEEIKDTYDGVIEEVNGIRVLHQPCAAYHFEMKN